MITDLTREGAPTALSHLSCVTLVYHTRNRPEFLVRALRHVLRTIGGSGIRVTILDASDEGIWAGLEPLLSEFVEPLRLTTQHSSSSTPLRSRLAEASLNLQTPYVLLAADDDLYFFEWLSAAVALLDSDPSFGVVYGHGLRFEVGGFSAYGHELNWYLDVASNPPARWLEARTPTERLRELGNPESDWATVGWYALQRTELLRLIATKANDGGFSAYAFEKFMIFCQAALTRTRMLGAVFLARQVNHDELRPPYSYAREEAGLPQLLRACALVLEQHAGVTPVAAASLVQSTFEGELGQLRLADTKRHLRRLANYFPALRAVWGRTLELMGHRPHFPLDGRFPAPPNITDESSYVRALRAAVEPPNRDSSAGNSAAS